MKKIITLLLVMFNSLLYAQFQWEETLISPIPFNAARYDDFSFINENIGYTMTSYTLDNKPVIDVLKTTNGRNWSTISRIENISGARSIKFFNKNIGFIGTLDSTILRTKDGGVTWEDLRNKLDTTILGICGMNITDSIVFGVGAWFGHPVFVKSENFGDSWIVKNMDDTLNGLVDVLFLNKNEGFISGSTKSDNKPIILYTSNGGLNWETKYIYSGITSGSAFVWKLFQLTDSIFYASLEKPSINNDSLIILKSSNRGLTWNELYVDSIRGKSAQGIGFLNENLGWVGGRWPGIYETKDGGTTWERKNTGSMYNRFQKINDNLMFASGGFIYRYGEHPNSIDNDYFIVSNKNNPVDHIKSINPNPAKNNVEIELFIPVKTFVSLNIYSLDGKLAKVVNHKQLPNGIHRLSSQIDDLAEGTYLITLLTNQNHESKRFVISE